jgi:PIN domain nuclease of toxin-antitoxin system
MEDTMGAARKLATYADIEAAPEDQLPFPDKVHRYPFDRMIITRASGRK